MRKRKNKKIKERDKRIGNRGEESMRRGGKRRSKEEERRRIDNE